MLALFVGIFIQLKACLSRLHSLSKLGLMMGGVPDQDPAPATAEKLEKELSNRLNAYGLLAPSSKPYLLGVKT